MLVTLITHNIFAKLRSYAMDKLINNVTEVLACM